MQGEQVMDNGKLENHGTNKPEKENQDQREKEPAESENFYKTLYENLLKTFDEVVVALASALEKRDPYTAGHQEQVSKIACAIAREMGMTPDRIEGLRIAGLLHDIGKIYVPSDILTKPSKLTLHEFGIIKAHPEAGYDILKGIQFPWPVARMVLQHHERLDGSGYPNGLTGEQILPEAKILAVADVVEAMSSHRPYRPALGMGKAIAEIYQHRGTVYDPEVVDACLQLFDKGFNIEG
jgi:putative nucleotidyltransferase with HDIG domain